MTTRSFAINCKEGKRAIATHPNGQKEKVGNGSLKLPLWLGKHYTIFGGPYYDKINYQHLHGVNMAEEIKRPATVEIPTQDFSVPNKAVLDKGLKEVVELLGRKKAMYVGCMGGRGRTGLFLAILAKAYGVKEPVRYVRKNYYSHAVETSEQQSFVDNYEIPKEVVKMVSAQKLRSIFSFSKNQTETRNYI